MLNAIEERLDGACARGLANAVSRALGDGELELGSKLPPIRTVAMQLGLSPSTVSAAWSMLARSGTIKTDGRRGTIITAYTPRPARYRRVLAHPAHFALDLSTGIPDAQLLPDLRPALQRVGQASVPSSYLDDPLLSELAQILHADWPFPAEQFMIANGAMDGLGLIVSSHLRFGDRVAVEEPTFPPLLDLLDSVGVVPLPVSLDEEGPTVAAVDQAIAAGVRAIFFQPRAQNPTGVSLSEDRCRALASTLLDSDVLVIEDDSAGAIASTPAVTLGTLLPRKTLHIRSYSKSHGPDLRLAAIGGPADLVDPLVERRFLGQAWTSRLLQSLLVDLLTDTTSIRAVENARNVYSKRRAAVVGALAADGIAVSGSDGLNIWLPVLDESAAMLSLAAQGIGVSAGWPFSVRPGGAQHLRVTVGLVRSGHLSVAASLSAAAHARTHTGPC